MRSVAGLGQDLGAYSALADTYPSGGTTKMGWDGREGRRE